MVKSNSVGLQSSLDPDISYNTAWQNVYYIVCLKESLVLSINEGVSRGILDPNQAIHQIGVNFIPIYNFDRVQTFAGGNERYSIDGTVLYSQFCTPTWIVVSDSSNF